MIKKNLKNIMLLLGLITPIAFLMLSKFMWPEVLWAFYCYEALIVVSYFMLLFIISTQLEPISKGQEATIVFAFFIASIFLIIEFGIGWMVFEQFKNATNEAVTPTSFDAFYFSAVTFTTLGYGDFVPKTDAGKFFVAVEALMGITHMVAFFSIAISRVVIQSIIKNTDNIGS